MRRLSRFILVGLVLTATAQSGIGENPENNRDKELAKFWAKYYDSLRNYSKSVEAARQFDALAAPAAQCVH